MAERHPQCQLDLRRNLRSSVGAEGRGDRPPAGLHFCIGPIGPIRPIGPMERALLMLAMALPGEKPPGDYAAVRPLVHKYCLACHATKVKKGDLDLERFATVDDVRKDVKPWQAVIEMLEAGEMPPKGKPQPSADERKRIIAWTRGFLDAEALARQGDPGRVPLRRLSHAEYDATIRDLTGVELRP